MASTHSTTVNDSANHIFRYQRLSVRKTFNKICSLQNITCTSTCCIPSILQVSPEEHLTTYFHCRHYMYNVHQPQYSAGVPRGTPLELSLLSSNCRLTSIIELAVQKYFGTSQVDINSAIFSCQTGLGNLIRGGNHCKQ